MCWGLAATIGMTVAGAAATLVTARRGEAFAVPLTLGYFTAMEGLQLGGYATLGECGADENRLATQASYAHIVLQPLVINAFVMAIAPDPVPRAVQRTVYALAALASAALALRLAPIPALGSCDPATAMCAEAFCTRPGDWHIAWEVPLNGGLQGALGWPVQFPAYFAAVFGLPLLYGAWRFALFHALAGPILAYSLTGDIDEMPAIWCLFSVGLLLTGMSPLIRARLMGAPAPT